MQDCNHKVHPVLRDLMSPASNGDSNDIPSPLQVLNHLLKTNVLTPEQVKSATVSLQSHDIIINNNNNKNSAETTLNNTIQQEHRTRHIALRFWYDGAKFSGLAQNVGQINDNSIERALFQALLKARLIDSRESAGYSRCGRTDRGVSSAGQVVALHLKSAIPVTATNDEEGNIPLKLEDLPTREAESVAAWVLPSRQKKTKTNQLPEEKATRTHKQLSEYSYARILNNLLPTEIRVLGWTPVSEEFSARFSATTRTYRYFFCRRQMDLDRIRRGLQLLVGNHDFRNFCKMDVEKVYNFERKVMEATLVEIGGGASSANGEAAGTQLCYFQIVGQAFLWHQIRCITEVLFMIGKGLEEPEVITDLFDIETYPGKPSYPLADEKPLVLHGCGYTNLNIGYSVQNIWTVSSQLEERWEELSLAAARIRNGITVFRDVHVSKQELAEFATAKLTERRKKLQRVGVLENNSPPIISLPVRLEELGDTVSDSVAWSDALEWLRKHGLVPDSNGLDNKVHVPLLRRSMGTTYEQKVESLKKSDKRRQKYEENIIKKRKTKEEDKAFYAHMAKQGDHVS